MSLLFWVTTRWSKEKPLYLTGEGDESQGGEAPGLMLNMLQGPLLEPQPIWPCSPSPSNYSTFPLPQPLAPIFLKIAAAKKLMLLGFLQVFLALPCWLSCKELVCRAENIGDAGSIPGSGRFPGEGNGNPLQYSCLGNLMYRGAWEVIVHGVAKSHTRLSNWATTAGIPRVAKWFSCS